MFPSNQHSMASAVESFPNNHFLHMPSAYSVSSAHSNNDDFGLTPHDFQQQLQPRHCEEVIFSSASTHENQSHHQISRRTSEDNNINLLSQAANNRDDDHVDQEIKKLKRRFANRESARRARVRKQQLVDHLQMEVDKLAKQNQDLLQKLVQLAEYHQQSLMENLRLREEIYLFHKFASNMQQLPPATMNNNANNNNDLTNRHYGIKTYTNPLKDTYGC